MSTEKVRTCLNRLLQAKKMVDAKGEREISKLEIYGFSH